MLASPRCLAHPGVVVDRPLVDRVPFGHIPEVHVDPSAREVGKPVKEFPVVLTPIGRVEVEDFEKGCGVGTTHQHR